MKVGTFIHCRFIRWKETKSAVREDRESQREREREKSRDERVPARERALRGDAEVEREIQRG
jgi:hypothetical protein